MKSKFIDCFMLMGSALSLQRGDQISLEVNRPILQDVFTTFVNVSLSLTDVHFKNTKTMEIEFTFLLHQHWNDPRLGPNSFTKNLAVNGRIWKPWITTTEGECRGNENEITQYWRGTAPEGNILYSEKIILKTFCTTNFKNFPFDSQICKIKLGTYRFPKTEVELIWNEIPLEILTEEIFNEFRLVNVVTYSETTLRPSGNFTILVVAFTFKRLYEHYLLCIFVPCLVIIFISYITFWIHPNNIIIRYFISFLNFYFLVYLNHYSISSLTLSYLKAIDIYIILCGLISLLTLFQNIVIDIQFRKENCEQYNNRQFHITKANYLKYRLLDLISYVLFPFLFICVMIFYFIMFLG